MNRQIIDICGNACAVNVIPTMHAGICVPYAMGFPTSLPKAESPTTCGLVTVALRARVRNFAAMPLSLLRRPVMVNSGLNSALSGGTSGNGVIENAGAVIALSARIRFIVVVPLSLLGRPVTVNSGLIPVMSAGSKCNDIEHSASAAL